MKYSKHVTSLLIEDVRAIATLRQDKVDISEEATPYEMIKHYINTLNSDYMTPENKFLDI